jgi:hypothetical protein
VPRHPRHPAARGCNERGPARAAMTRLLHPLKNCMYSEMWVQGPDSKPPPLEQTITVQVVSAYEGADHFRCAPARGGAPCTCPPTQRRCRCGVLFVSFGFTFPTPLRPPANGGSAPGPRAAHNPRGAPRAVTTRHPLTRHPQYHQPAGGRERRRCLDGRRARTGAPVRPPQRPAAPAAPAAAVLRGRVKPHVARNVLFPPSCPPRFVFLRLLSLNVRSR